MLLAVQAALTEKVKSYYGRTTGAFMGIRIGIQGVIGALLLTSCQLLHGQTGPAGTITTVVGNGTAGYSGDGGLGISATIGVGIFGFATDASGNLYFSDVPRVRKLNVATGIVTTVAGTGTYGSSGDGGLAVNAQLFYPSGLAVDAAGNLYIVDQENNVIRKVDVSTGIISTIAGSSNFPCAFGGDGGPATSAELCRPNGIAFDSVGNLYIADSFNYRIRMISASTGFITTIAGNGSESASGDGGPATEAGVDFPAGIGLDVAGNVYFTDGDNGTVRIIAASTGIVTTVAGNGVPGYSGDGGPATSAQMETPANVALDSSGNLFISDFGVNGSVVRMVNATTGVISTLVGNGQGRYSGDGGPATSATVDQPYALTLDQAGNLYVGDLSDIRIRVVSSAAAGSLSALSGTVSFSLNPFSLGDTVQITTQASCNQACGNVDYRVDGAEWGTVALDDTGSFQASASSYTNPEFTLGSHILTVRYLGNSGYAAETLANVPFTINPDGTTAVTVTASLSSTTFSLTDNPAFSVSVSCNSACGTVNYMIDGVLWSGVALDSNGNFVGHGPNLTVGSHVFTVQYLGDSQYAPATSNPVAFTVTGQTATASLYNFQITGFQPTGNITSYTDSVNGTWSNLGYDHLNRLAGGTQAISGSPTRYFCWTYDSFGNRLTQTISAAACPGGSSPPTSQASYDASNRLTGNQIISPGSDPNLNDADGNVQHDGVNQYLYDDEGRVCVVMSPPVMAGLPAQLTQYIYDAEGRRVAKGSVTSFSCDMTSNGFSPSSSYALDLEGNQITETDGAGNWVHTNVFTENGLLATYNDAGVHFQISDWLRTLRVQTDSQGVVESTFQGMPFGEMPVGQTTGSTEHHFTGKERDSESGLDYFGARYYGSNSGRWMSPDWADKPEAIPYSDLGNPQSLNLYAYVGNNPIRSVDPTGHIEDLGSFFDMLDNLALNSAAAKRGSQKSQQKNSTQRSESAAEAHAKGNMQKYGGSQPGDNGLNLSPVAGSCGTGNHNCQYALSGGGSEKLYVYEHQTSGVLGGQQVGDADYVTPGYGGKANTGIFYDDIGGTSLDTYRFFTVSGSSTYNPSDQRVVPIRESGGLVGFEHMYATGGAVYINGSTNISP
jgi:RHS repeat-associated protein